MKQFSRILLNTLLTLVFMLAPLAETAQPVLAQGTGCATSSPPSGAYTVTICFSEPLDGSSLSGDTVVTATISVTGTNPGTQRMVFYLNGDYLLTDFQSSYTFILPTTKWIDGTYTLSVEAFMRDAFVTQRAELSLTYNNGIVSPPINANQFQPSAGLPPINGAPFTVIAGGDGASGEINADKVTDLIKALNPNLFIYLGDVYNKGTATEFYNWYGTENVRFGQFRAITNPTVGNHEYENGVAPGYFDYWDNIPSYYSYEAGGWHFINLNSNSTYEPVDPQSAQYQWLQQDLAAHAQACTIVYYHHPLFNIGPEGSSTVMADIWNLMASYGVDIVLTGHDHTYQRWVPLDGNGQPSSNGITEFVAGASGHGLQTIGGSDSRVAFATDANPTGFGALVLQLNQNGANFSYVNTNQIVLDSGVIPCVPASPDSQPPTTPGGFSANAVSATQVDLAWSASSDDTGVSGYTVYRDGNVLTTVAGASLSYSDLTTLPSTIYQYSVDAFDPAGNHSAGTTPIEVTTPEMPASMTFPVTADTYVNAGSPSSNYGSALTFRLDSSPDLHGYLRFNIQGLAGTPITQARLLVYANNTTSLGINAQPVTDNSWGEATVNYNNAPALGGILASSGPITAGSWVTLDVTSAMSGEGTYSFGITTPSASALSFPTRESGLNAPQLILDLQNNSPDTQPPTDPTNLVGAASSASQVDLTWNASTDNFGVTGYIIYRDTLTLATIAGTNSLYSDTTVAPSTTYTYTVDAFDQAGNHSGLSNPVTVTTPAIPTSLALPPEADTYVNADLPASNYGTAVTLRADSTPDIHSYLRFNVQGLFGRQISQARLLVYTNVASSLGINIQTVADNTWGELTTNYSNAPAMGSIVASSGSFTTGSWVTLDVTSLVTGDGPLSFGISTPSTSAISLASRESGANAPQLLIDFLDNQPPTVPTGLTAFVSSSTQVDLTWSASTDNLGVNGYTIFRDGAVLTTVSGSTLSYNDTTILSGNTYQYAVDAFDLAGNHSAASALVAATTPDTVPPTVPTGLTALIATSTQVDLTWNASTDNLGVSGYTIFRDGAVLTTVSGSSLSYSDTSVLPGNTYQYAVDAFDLAGNHSAASVPVSSATPDTLPPTVPTGLTALISAPTQVDLTWNASTDNLAVSGYTVFRNGAVLTTVSGTTLSYSDSTVLSGNTYQYAVDAFDLAGNHSVASAPVAVTTPDTTPPSVPTGLTASAPGYTQVNLTWTASTDNQGISGYTLFRDGAVLATVSGATLSYSDTTLLPGNTYQYALDAFDLAGNHSVASAPVAATTPNLPSSLTYTPVADTYVSSGSPSSNYGTRTSLRADASPIMQSYLRFDVQGLFGKPIHKATLRFYANNTTSLGFTTYSVTNNSWAELNTNYSNAPAMGSVLASSGPITTGNWVTLDVTPFVTGEGNFSFGVTTPSSSGVNLASRETGATAPQLILEILVNGPDVQSPTVPSSLTATPVNYVQIDLAWEAATDDLGVAGYTIFRNGVALTTLPGTSLSYSDTSVSPATPYSYTIDAFDQAGNYSALSDPAQATTPDVPPSLTFNPVADTYVSASKPSSNYGKTTTLRADVSPDLHSYLRFSVQGLGGKTITRARLLFYSNSNNNQGFQALSVADNNWGELTMNYNTAPVLGNLVTASGPITNGNWVTLDVTAYINDEGTFSFGITTPSSTAISLSSRESGTNQPQLIIDLQ